MYAVNIGKWFLEIIQDARMIKIDWERLLYRVHFLGFFIYRDIRPYSFFKLKVGWNRHCLGGGYDDAVVIYRFQAGYRSGIRRIHY